jgi:predicted DNA-binding protein YlxM (UPF0122 family)
MKPKKQKLNTKSWLWFKQKKDAGWTFQKIADYFGCTRQAVQHYMSINEIFSQVPPKRIPISKFDLSAIEADIKKGLTSEQIEKKHSCSKDIVYSLVGRKNLKLNPIVRTPAFKNKAYLKDLYVKKQLSTIQIAVMHNVSNTAVLLGLRRFGIKIRPKGRYKGWPTYKYPMLHDKKWLKGKLKEGLNFLEIADIVGCHPTYVSIIAKGL